MNSLVCEPVYSLVCVCVRTLDVCVCIFIVSHLFQFLLPTLRRVFLVVCSLDYYWVFSLSPFFAASAPAHCSLAFRVVVAEIPFTLSIRSLAAWLTTFMRVYWEPGMTFIVLHDI